MWARSTAVKNILILVEVKMKKFPAYLDYYRISKSRLASTLEMHLCGVYHCTTTYGNKTLSELHKPSIKSIVVRINLQATNKSHL